MVGKLLLVRVAAHQRIEMCLTSGGFGPQHTPEPLGFFLPRTKGAGYLQKYLRIREIERKVTDLREHQQGQRTGTEERIQPLTFALGRLARNQRRVTGYGNLFELIQILPNDQRWCSRVACQNVPEQDSLDWILGSDAELFAGEGRGIGHAHITRQRTAHLGAGRLCNPASSLQVAPWDIVLLWPNQTKDIAFTPILAHERRRES